MYLIQDAVDTKFAGLLTDGSVSTGISQFFTSSGLPPSHSSSGSTSTDYSNPFVKKKDNPPAAAPTVVPAPAPAAAAAAAAPSPPKQQQPRASVPGRPATTNTSAAAASSSSLVTTTVMKGDLGIGLDLEKSTRGLGRVLRFKAFPDGAVNPATQSTPAIQPGDEIVGVNGTRVGSFAEAVKLIRAAPTGQMLQLMLERCSDSSGGDDLD